MWSPKQRGNPLRVVRVDVEVPAGLQPYREITRISQTDQDTIEPFQHEERAIRQIRYAVDQGVNYVDTALIYPGTEGLRYAASKGLGVVIMEPLRGGYLARNPPAPVQAVWDEADVKRTPAEWALRWVWNHPEVTVVLSGMNDEQHIEENIRVAGEANPNSLTKKELDIVGRAAEAYRATNRVGCTGCRYCMPCPAGVNIPGCFEAYNTDSGTLQSKVMYHLRVGGKMDGAKLAYASLCKDCGKCVKVCPQHLPIPEVLREVARDYETLGARVIGGATVYALRLMRWNTMRNA